MASSRVRARSDLIRIREAAEILGVSTQIVYRLVWDGELPAVKLSERAVRVERADVLELAKTWTAPGYLSTPDVAELFGLSERTIQDYAKAGILPSERHRGRLRFRKRDVETFLEERRTRAK